MILCICVWECTGWCDVITLMVFYLDWSLNPDIKAVGCFHMHRKMACGGHSCLKSSLMLNGRTHKSTPGQNHNKWAKYEWMGLCNYVHDLIYFFSSMWINLRKHLPDPRLGLLSVSISSWTWLIKIFMSRIWQEYYYFHYLYYGLQARKKKKKH